MKVPLGDEIDMKIEAFNFQGGQYKKMGDKKLDKFCLSLYQDSFEKPYKQYYDAITVKVPFGTCPYPAGINEINNMMIEEDGFLPKYVPGGEKWRIDVRFLKKGEVLGGYNVYALLRSEESLLKGG